MANEIAFYYPKCKHSECSTLLNAIYLPYYLQLLLMRPNIVRKLSLVYSAQDQKLILGIFRKITC